MSQASQANDVEYGELSRALDQLAERAPTLDPTELVARWPALERRVLARVRADKHVEGNALADREQPEEQRVRNLAWEIGVSVDLQAVHVGAIRALAKLLSERAQRFGRRAASPRSNEQAVR